MEGTHRSHIILIAILLIVSVAFTGGPAHARDATPTAGPVTVVASGLSNPRGFTWGPDGTLYLAQAGIGGDTILAEAEGFTAAGGPTASVVTIADGCAAPLADGIHSVLWQEAGWVWGAMDVELLNGQLYVLVSGSGASWGTPDLVSGIYRVGDDGALSLVADISAWLPDNPPEFAAPDYSGMDGSEFDMEPLGDAFLVSVADGGQIIRAVPDGELTMLADLSVGHLVPTGIAVDADGNAYVGFETTPPYPNGASKVVQITPDGTVSDYWTGLTAVTDIEIGPDGMLYAAEMSIDNSEQAPFLNSTSGRIVRQTGPDTLEAVVTDAPPPVALGFDADGALYVAAPAYGPNGDAGEGIGFLARVDLAGGPVSLTGFESSATCM